MFKLFKRSSRKLFNTNWEYVRGSDSKTFKSCYKKFERESKKIIQTSISKKLKSYIQFEIRNYKKDKWGDIIIATTKRYTVKKEE